MPGRGGSARPEPSATTKSAAQSRVTRIMIGAVATLTGIRFLLLNSRIQNLIHRAAQFCPLCQGDLASSTPDEMSVEAFQPQYETALQQMNGRNRTAYVEQMN
ncbi:hypothetical protein [Bradyrhizobium genosp. P]|uniref:hypothetical protein n=1 Tax=Bradyrhizobium genosp. P TaxID=83641 RepID=UPI003CE736C5